MIVITQEQLNSVLAAQKQLLDSPNQNDHATAETLNWANTIEATSEGIKNSALMVAQDAALAHAEDHSYLPKTKRQAYRWYPHSWVLKAMLDYATQWEGKTPPPDSIVKLALENHSLLREVKLLREMVIVESKNDNATEEQVCVLLSKWSNKDSSAQGGAWAVHGEYLDMEAFVRDVWKTARTS